MSSNPEVDTITRLEELTISGIGALVEGTNVFRGPIIASLAAGDSFPIPQQAIFVRASGGSPPLIHPFDAVQEKAFLIDIFVRGEPMSYASTRAIAQTILDHLNDNPTSSYYRAKTVASQPQWIDQEDSGAHIFVVTLELWALEA